MALDVTEGGATANSYCTLVEANAYHDARALNPEWYQASDEDKERHLKWAAKLLGQMFKFIGSRMTREQALDWPRAAGNRALGPDLDSEIPFALYDVDGFVVSGIVPPRIKEAQAELAFQTMKDDWVQGLGPITDKGVKVGPIQTTEEEHRPIPHPVLLIVAELAESADGPSEDGWSVLTTVAGG
jgi:hypothetical protein